MSLSVPVASLLLLFAIGCGDSTGSSPDAGSSAPTIVATTPLEGATGAPINVNITALFSAEMDAATVNATTFTLRSGATAVPGTVLYADSTATFWPAARLASNTSFTAAITNGAMSAAGVELEANHSWTFMTGARLAAEVPVPLRTAGNFVILAKSAISTVPASAVTGDIAVSPAAASYITGFAMTADASNAYATSAQITGKAYAANYASPTPSKLTTAVGDMEHAYTDAASRAADVTELGAGNIGGMTLTPGVYKWGTGLLIPTSVTLTGDATSVWIFQIAQGLTLSSGTRIELTGGALAKNVFWEVAGGVELGTTAHLEGVVLGKTSITLRTGASINGRLLAQTAVSVDGSTVVQPAQ
jgi:hypothetical protein